MARGCAPCTVVKVTTAQLSNRTLGPSKEEAMPRVPVDFNTIDWDPEDRVWINTIVNKDLAGILRPGLRVLLYDTGLEVEATVECDAGHPSRQWLARPQWSTRRDVPVQG